MTDSDQKTEPGSAMQVSEAEVEAFVEQAGPGIDGAQAGSATAAVEPDSAAPPSPGPGAKPPPLPRRRPPLARLKRGHIIGFLVLCAVLGPAIGLLWNLVFGPEAEPAAPAAEAKQGAVEPEQDAVEQPPAAVEIRLGEMVVTSDEEEGEGSGSETGENKPQ
jgi:hypothetical protein